MKKKSILYLGQSKKFNDFFYSDVQKKSLQLDYELIEFNYHDNSQLPEIVDILFTNYPSLIFLEVLKFDKEIINFLLMIKFHSKLRQVKIFTCFSDQENLYELEDLYSFGLEYGYLQDEEAKVVFTDALYLSEYQEIELLEFATVNSIRVPAQIYSLAKMNSISGDHLYLESSIPMIESNNVNIQFKNFPEYKHTRFKVVSTESFQPRSLFSYSSSIRPIDEDENYLSNNIPYKEIEGTYPRNERILVIDNRDETFKKLIPYLNTKENNLNITDTLDDYQVKLKKLIPQIIFYQMQEEADDLDPEEVSRLNGPTSFQKLVFLINQIPGYNPYILIFNENSRTRAYRKAFRYDAMITNSNNFKLSHIEFILKGYMKNKPLDSNRSYFFSPDKRTVALIELEITITSLSEHYITFLYEENLQHFSSLRLNTPSFSTYLTIIPPTRELEKKGTQSHHMAILTNTSEKEKMEIRKLVNMMLKLAIDEKTEFSLRSVDELRSEIILAKKEELDEQRTQEKKVLDELKETKDQTVKEK